MNPFRWLVERARGGVPEQPATGPGDAWHRYEQPTSKEVIMVYNGTPFQMPMHLVLLDGKRYVHTAPFDGVPNTKAELEPGDWVWRRATLEERKKYVADRVRAENKAVKGQPFKLRAEHLRKSDYMAEAAKMCVVARLPGS